MTMQIEMTDEDWKVVGDYKMPKVNICDMVVWYNQGDTSSEPKWGFVWKIDGRSIVILKMAQDDFQRPTESCRHKDDPELRFKPNLRSKGTWDFHPKHKASADRIAALEARIAQLETGMAPVVAQVADTGQDDLKESLDAINKLTPAKEQEIVNFAAEGMKPGKIAEVLGGGWTPQRVGLVLKKTQLVADTPEMANA